MRNSENWTLGRSLLLLFLCFDVIIIGFWLVIFFEFFPAIREVTAGIWAAGIALLTFLGVRITKSKSVASMLGQKPVKIIGIVFTILIFLLSPLAALQKMELRKVEIDPRFQGFEFPVHMELKHNTEKDLYYKYDGNGVWQFSAKVGNYTLVVEPKDTEYQKMTLAVDICFFCLTNNIGPKDILPKSGTLIISVFPKGHTLTILGTKNNKEIYKGQIVDKDKEWTIATGEYLLVATAKNHEEETTPIKVSPGKIIKRSIVLKRKRGTLVLRPDPKGMNIIIDGERKAYSTPYTVTLLSGQHEIIMYKEGSNDRFGFYYKKVIEVITNENRKIDPTLDQIRLPVIIIIPSQTGQNNVYYLESSWDSERLGLINEPKRISVFPGEYRIIKELNDNKTHGAPFEIKIDEREVQIRNLRRRS